MPLYDSPNNMLMLARRHAARPDPSMPQPQHTAKLKGRYHVITLCRVNTAPGPNEIMANGGESCRVSRVAERTNEKERELGVTVTRYVTSQSSSTAVPVGNTPAVVSQCCLPSRALHGLLPLPG